MTDTTLSNLDLQHRLCGAVVVDWAGVLWTKEHGGLWTADVHGWSLYSYQLALRSVQEAQ